MTLTNEPLMYRLFIYGTLMPGLRLQAEMRGARYVGAGQVPGRLVDVGRYSGFLRTPLQHEDLVMGEVYEVDADHLALLDEVEDMVSGDRAASQYWREEVTVAVGPLRGQQVQIYVYNRPVDCCATISHGDYRRYIGEVGRES